MNDSGKKWYQPANDYAYYDGENFLDKRGMVLIRMKMVILA